MNRSLRAQECNIQEMVSLHKFKEKWEKKRRQLEDKSAIDREQKREEERERDIERRKANHTDKKNNNGTN